MTAPYVPGNGLNAFPKTLPPEVTPGPPVSGTGSPEGVVAAVPGTTYLDNGTQRVWVKVAGVQSHGWEMDPS